MTRAAADQFLLSGEFHYFRVPRPHWHDRLMAMRDAGLDTVSIYIPWNWHQPTASTMDFAGRSTPERDLLGALDEIENLGLSCIYRPGPFITAEWHGGGIPDWFLEEHPSARAIGATGFPVVGGDYPAITYAHPAYTAASMAWLESALAIVADRMAERGGCITSVQLDDEPSYWQRLSDPLALDYNPVLVAPGVGGSPWARFVIARHGSLQAAAEAHRAPRWNRPEDVEPPRVPMAEAAELPRYLDWLDFKLFQINEYVARCARTARQAGATGRLSMLYPYLLSLQARKFSDFAAGEGLDLHLTNECYLSLLGPESCPEQKLAAVISTHEAYHLWRRPEQGPPVTMELQSSNASFLSPGAMELLYGLTIARGIRGTNFFMMVGGKNPPGFENETGSEYDISAPIAADGRLRPHYDVIAKFARMVRAAEPELHSAEPLRDVVIGVHLDYDAASMAGGAFLLDAWGLQTLIPHGDMGLSQADGLPSLFATASISWGLVDLSETTERLGGARQCWVGCLDYLDRDVQERMIGYVQSGGHLVVLPQLPRRNSHFEDDDRLARFAFSPADPPLFAGFAGGLAGSTLVREAGGGLIVAPGQVTRFDPPPDAEILAWAEADGGPCAFTRVRGNGRITVLGFRLGYNPTAGPAAASLCRRVVEAQGYRCVASSSDPQFAAFVLSGSGGGMLCVANPVDVPGRARVAIEVPGSRGPESRRIPVLLGGIEFGGRGARLLPIDVSLGPSGTLVQSTAELVGRDLDHGRATLTFAGGHGSEHELVVDGSAARGLPENLRIEGGSVTGIHDGPRPGNRTLLVHGTGNQIRCTFSSGERCGGGGEELQ